MFAVSGIASAETVVLRGHLVKPVDDEPLRFETSGSGTVEIVTDSGLEMTMRDPQLATRTWELRGTMLEADRISVRKIFTIKDGELHRVTYYCEICHITTHEPGLCMCCQGDTDLRELPGE